MKRGGLTRRTPLVARAELRRVTRLQAKPVPLHRTRMTTRRRKPDVPAEVRAVVARRSGGRCECGCWRRAEHVHHRKLRSQGGKHEPANLVHLSHECHALVHANPERGYALGLLVRGWADPADVPVVKGMLR